MSVRLQRLQILLIGGALAIVLLWWYSSKPSPPKSPAIYDPIERKYDKVIYQPRDCVYVDGKCVPENDADFKLNLPKKALYAYKDNFYLDGKPFKILSGSFHYFRSQPAVWGDRLHKMKAAGLNTVMTYIPWNLHEKVHGRFTFNGWWDISAFIEQVHRVGLKLIVRPGPYIAAEWEFGGLPSWLLSDPNMIVRSSKCQKYLKQVRSYFSKVLPILASYQYRKGRGPIIAFQIENEFGSYGNDPEYLNFLKELYKEFGIEELLFTSDGMLELPNGTLPKVLAATNFKEEAEEHLNVLKKFQPDLPLLVTEFWSGWFDHWGEEHNTYSAQEFTNTVNLILNMNASINFYMFVGGTNFGFWNGANNLTYYDPAITSYDYDAPIGEDGSLTPKYFALKEILKKRKLVPKDLPAAKNVTDTSQYGAVKIEHYINYTDILQLINPEERNILFDDVVPMEYLPINNEGGQGYGWILYETNFTEGKQLSFQGIITDRAQIFINDILIHTTSHREKYRTDMRLNISSDVLNTNSTNTLSILVENMGRVNFGRTLDIQRKGIQGTLYIDGIKLTKWQHTALAFDRKFRQQLQTSSTLWLPYKQMPSESQQHIPAVYKGSFEISGYPKDTFIWMKNWTKGIVIVNDNNLGRYWSEGPQRTLYIPAQLLKQGKNDVIVFELHKPFDQVEFIGEPKLQ